MADAPSARSESVRLTFWCDESEAEEDFLARVKAIKAYVDQHWNELLRATEPIDTDALPAQGS